MEEPITKSWFKFCGSATLQRKTIKIGQVLGLIQNSSSALEDKVYLNARLENVVFDAKWSSFVTVGTNKNGLLLWNRRWCVINGFSLKFYNYPTDEFYNRVVETLNLKNVLCPILNPVDLSLCTRPRTLVLSMGASRQETRFLISLDKKEDVESFKNIVENICMALKHWKLLTYAENLNNN